MLRRLIDAELSSEYIHMRVTLNLDDDALREAKRYAQARSIGLGRAVSDLVRRGLNAPIQTKTVNGIHVVVLPADSPKATSALVRELLNR